MLRFSLALALAALAVPAVAAAKGPSEGSISGPGFAKTVKVLYDGGGGSPGDALTQASGFFPASFGQTPDPMLHGKPSGPLGPRYVVVWTVPSGGPAFRVRQELYPYARGGGVSYTKPGQAIFGTTTRGGWYRDRGLKRSLVTLGLPVHAPGRSDGTGWTLPGGLAAGALAAGAVLLLWRRQRALASGSTEPAGSQT